jgi:hypothetical protein
MLYCVAVSTWITKRMENRAVLLDKLMVDAATQQVPCFLYKPKVYYSVHRSPQPIHILSKMNVI